MLGERPSSHDTLTFWYPLQYRLEDLYMARDLFSRTALTCTCKYELSNEFVPAIWLSLLGLLLPTHWLDVDQSFVLLAHHTGKETLNYHLEMRPR